MIDPKILQSIPLAAMLRERGNAEGLRWEVAFGGIDQCVRCRTIVAKPVDFANFHAEA